MKKAPKEKVIRARCSSDLKDKVNQIARIQNLEEADIIRIACETYVQRIQSAFKGQPLAVAA